jgi:hypothetical protein
MAGTTLAAVTELEGKVVDVALDGGRRLDGCQLVSVPRRKAGTLWLFVAGEDVFVRPAEVLAVWEHRL